MPRHFLVRKSVSLVRKSVSPNRVMVAVAATGALVLQLAVGFATGNADAPPANHSPSSRTESEVAEITLITGDQLHVRTLAEGRLAVSVTPAERESGLTPEFHQVEIAGELHVIPGDARGLVAAGSLDQDLFNVTDLLAHPVASSGGTPVIVTFAGELPTRSMAHAAGLPGTEDAVVLDSVDGMAFDVDATFAEDFWASLTTPTPKTGALRVQPTVEKVWLDGVLNAALEDSVPQIGAPDAWGAGYDGSGTTVAILDTGIDDSHPDLAGTVVSARGFTNEDSTSDGHGHGTHVAATVAGTGDGSDGLRPGVAPGADLLNGKVLNDEGSGMESWIISGMEWATDSGADVVNLSLGGSPTDGTDPLSLAVDQLTESSDTLFVIAAGNDGRASYVSSPGAASAALTVGAVNDNDTLASFSNRGPRLGDYAIKPDITAPGVGIVAARATGTSMGTPVDDLYTSANGTSMATPHVAGAAAILLERFPDLRPDQLKSALIGSAAPRSVYTVYQQGGGRVDVGAAVTATVLADQAPLDLGYFTWPYDDAEPVSETVTLTSLADTDQTLELTLQMETEGGAAAPPGMVTLSEERVALPAAGTAEVAVTVDPRLGDHELYSGYLTGTVNGQVVVSVPTGFYKEDERVTLTVQGIARDGAQATGRSFVDVTNVDDIEKFASLTTEFLDGTATLRVPPGTYSVMGGVYTYEEGSDEPVRTEFVMVGDPQVEVDHDTTVVLDARTANPVMVDVQTHEVDYHQDGLPNVTLEFMRRDLQGVVASHGVSFADWPSFAAPTDPVTQGEFEFSTRHILTQPDQGFGGPYLFDIESVAADAIPADLTYEVTEATLERDFAQLENSFHANAEEVPYAEFRHHFRPYQRGSLAFARHYTVPLQRLDYVSATDSRWNLDVLQTERLNGSVVARMFGGGPTVYNPGDRFNPTWYRSPFRPTFRDGIVEGQAELQSVRDGDVLDLLIYAVGDAEVGHSSLAFYFDDLETTFRLYEDGAEIASAARARGDFPVSPGSHEYRLELDTTASGPYDFARRSTQTRTAWTVQSPRTPAQGQTDVLPLLHVDYDLPLDLSNRLTKPGANWFGLHVRHQQGAVAASVQGLRVWFSTDEGASWQESRVVQDRGNGDFRVHHLSDPHYTGDTSIRIEAWDGSGNKIEQELIRAFGSRN